MSKKIPLIEMFGPTIQGEGLHIGSRTYFLRFGLCDYKCTMCDSMHAVDPLQVKKNADYLTQGEIVEKFLTDFPKAQPGEWITLSGGNPAIHDLSRLVTMFNAMGFILNIETQGTKNPEWLCECESITCSPKGPGMGEKFEPDVFFAFLRSYPEKKINVKVVVFDQRDIEFAKDVFSIARLQGITDLYLSLGNPYPPQHTNLDYLDDTPHAHSQTLLNDYAALIDDVLQEPTLKDVKFLPQLHVLTYSNQQCV